MCSIQDSDLAKFWRNEFKCKGTVFYSLLLLLSLYLKHVTKLFINCHLVFFCDFITQKYNMSPKTR